MDADASIEEHNSENMNQEKKQHSPFADAPFAYKMMQFEAKSADPIRIQKLTAAYPFGVSS